MLCRGGRIRKDGDFRVGESGEKSVADLFDGFHGDASGLAGSHQGRRWFPYRLVLWWLKVVLAELGNLAVALNILSQMPGGIGSFDIFAADFRLQLDEAVQECLRSRRATRDKDVDGDEPIDAFENIVTLLEGSARNRARAHRDAIFRLGHLIPQTDDLWGHLFGDRS